MRKRSYLKTTIVVVMFALGGFLVFTQNPQASAAQGNPFSEWLQSKHSIVELAQEEATVENRGTTAAHCGRCHSEQGFVAWVPQILAGDPGNIKQPDGSAATEDYLASLGLTLESVRPQTCRACHSDTGELRISDNTPLLPAGFQALAVGKGALCMTCHNTRNGRISWDAATTGSLGYRGPHEPSQADVINGKNVYFVNDTMDLASPHMLYTGDSCVTCHKELGGGHTFEPAGETLCMNCHGPVFNIEFVQKPTNELLNQLIAAIGQRVVAHRSQIRVVAAWNPETDETQTIALDGNQITGIDEVITIHGRIAVRLTLSIGSSVYTQLQEIKTAGAAASVFPTSDPIVRACWNYLMIHSDSSGGVHNPRFARDVLTASINALK